MVAMLVALLLGAQPPAIKLSQHGTVSQEIAATRITVEYDRPTARGRELPGKLIPYDRVWCPGANECTTFTTTTNIKVEGRTLPAGTYTVWAQPGPAKWTIIFNRAHPVFHTQYARYADQDFLKVDVTPQSGPHMETLMFSFPAVDGTHAQLALHWGTIVVPLEIDVP
ncbi:MAG TPA: DUF2911 domain-containing protein [Vicinamibacterales bacterium]|jgi:hypothetical protein